METKNLILALYNSRWTSSGGGSHIILPKAHISIPVASIIGIFLFLSISYVVIRVIIELKRDKKMEELEVEKKRRIIKRSSPKRKL